MVGVFGRWGTGKTTLLKMLAERLDADNRQRRKPTVPDVLKGKIGFKDYYRTFINRQGPSPQRLFTWRLVQFSPWVYRHKETLLLPLLATLAKSDSAFKELVREILAFAPSLAETVKDLGLGAAQAGLPLLTFLSSIRKAKRGRSIQELSDRIAGAVGKITKRRERLVFLIDDLDRCHDPEQVVWLLEQIKLFLHIEHCLFFIFADRGQILAAINKRYPGEGVSYLEKFVQLSIDLPPHDSRDLTGLLPETQDPDDQPLYAYWERLAEALGHNPRKLKKLWNRTQVCLDLIRQERDKPGEELRPASPYLMAKWLLMMEQGFLDDPYASLDFEAASPSSDGESPIEQARKLFFGEGERKFTAEQRRVLTFPLAGPQRARLRRAYGREPLCACGRDGPRAAAGLPRGGGLRGHAAGWANGLLTGRSEWRRVLGLALHRLRSPTCSFRRRGPARLSLQWLQDDDAYVQFVATRALGQLEDCLLHDGFFKAARLDNTRFLSCELLGACFDDAVVEGTSWIQCRNIDELQTDAATYKAIADIMAGQWRSERGEPWAGADREQLYKTYETIVNADNAMREEQRVLSAKDRERLKDKARKLRDDLEAATASQPETSQDLA